MITNYRLFTEATFAKQSLFKSNREKYDDKYPTYKKRNFLIDQPLLDKIFIKYALVGVFYFWL